MATVRWKRLALILAVVVAVSAIVLGYSIYFATYAVRDVSIKEVVSDPQSFDDVHVRLRGYIVRNVGSFFGPKYVLRDLEDGVEIALSGKGVDFEPYVSFVFDGTNYTQIRNISISVKGYVRYIGPCNRCPFFPY